MNKQRFQFRAIFTQKPFNDEPINTMVYFNIDGTENSYILCSRSYLNGKYILMQNSTLIDTNGVSIFDGDIITYVYNYTEYIRDVIFMKGMFAVKVDKNKLMSLASLMTKTTLTVIGNKYQNPELLM